LPVNVSQRQHKGDGPRADDASQKATCRTWTWGASTTVERVPAGGRRSNADRRGRPGSSYVEITIGRPRTSTVARRIPSARTPSGRAGRPGYTIPVNVGGRLPEGSVTFADAAVTLTGSTRACRYPPPARTGGAHDSHRSLW